MHEKDACAVDDGKLQDSMFKLEGIALYSMTGIICTANFFEVYVCMASLKYRFALYNSVMRMCVS